MLKKIKTAQRIKLTFYFKQLENSNLPENCPKNIVTVQGNLRFQTIFWYFVWTHELNLILSENHKNSILFASVQWLLSYETILETGSNLKPTTLWLVDNTNRVFANPKNELSFRTNKHHPPPENYLAIVVWSCLRRTTLQI